MYIPYRMVVTSSLRYFSSEANPNSFTLSYLVKRCGLSPESALSASKTLQFKTSEKPELVRSSLKKLGFSKTQISEIIRKFPGTLACNPQKVIAPKFEFFRSKGASKGRLEAHLIPNVNTLRNNGVPVANILGLIQYQPRIIQTNSEKFGTVIEEVRKVGFNPLQSQFIRAITVLAGLSKSTRDRKFAVYRKWGWSKRVTIAAFKRSPCCLAISEAKIMEVMDFYVNQLGLASSVLARRPKLLSLSLKKRLIPRAAVIEFLASKGVVKLDSRRTSLFEYTEKHFLEKYVNCHEEPPYLLKLYNDKLNC